MESHGYYEQAMPAKGPEGVFARVQGLQIQAKHSTNRFLFLTFLWAATVAHLGFYQTGFRSTYLCSLRIVVVVQLCLHISFKTHGLDSDSGLQRKQ